MDIFNADSYWLARSLFERSLALLYFVAFLVAWNQVPALLGERGLLPIPQYVAEVPFAESPSLFYWHYSDTFLKGLSLFSMLVSLAFIFGLSAFLPIWLHVLLWLLLWFFYYSLMNVGQTFYGFGWESMLCEAGFFCAFLGPSWMKPSYIPLVILWWMLFRVEVGAGLIKLRGDVCWKDLTCLFYHHETQPIPNPLSWYFHHLPKVVLKMGVVFSHFVQLIAPFALFLPNPLRLVAVILIIVHQGILIVGGNYSWLNWATVVLGLSAMVIPRFETPPQELLIRPMWYDIILILLGVWTLYLSIAPIKNFFARRQLMNASFNIFRLVNAYGAFGSVTKERYEIVIEGTEDDVPNPGSIWKEYEFKGKPGDLKNTPRQYAPYHLRLDWLMWFLPFSVQVHPDGVAVSHHEIWFIRFIQKLLEGDTQILGLIRTNPFAEDPPKFIRTRYYLYRFTSKEEKRNTGNIWKRTLVGEYLPPLSLREIRNALGD